MRDRAKQDFALRISERASYAELRVQRAFGEDWITAYGNAWRVMDEVYDLVLAPDKPAVHPRTDLMISRQGLVYP
jgi:hypothetical protein